MSIYTSPGSSNNDHIRHLLHQRNAPFNIHTHFSPSNSPSSVYSHSQSTPRPIDTLDLSASPYTSSRSSPFDHHPLNHLHNSAPDLDDDLHSSYPSSSLTQGRSSYCMEQDDEPEHRMSMLGIKMRFHSRAPWEMGEDDIVEEDEPDHASIYRPSSRSKRSLKGFGGASRPSAESSRSGSVGKKSFETSSSQMSTRGALQALAQASMSSSSLSLAPTPPPGQSILRHNLCLPRTRTRTISNPSRHPYSSGNSSPRAAVPFVQPSPPTTSTRPVSPTMTEYSQGNLDIRSVLSRSSPVGHPYANPELVGSCTRDPERDRSDSQGDGLTSAHSNDSLATLMSSQATTSSIDNYAASIYSTHSTHSSPVSVPKERVTPKDISAPRLAPSALQPYSNPDGKRRETRVFPTSVAMANGAMANGMAGWRDQQTSAFTLISLEEARALRTRTTTLQPVPNESSGSTLAFPPANASPSGPTVLTRPRGRSISGTGKAKPTSEYTRSNPPAESANLEGAPGGKILKHKKSGFMRIFAKEKDRAPMPSPPPLSGFPDIIPPVPRTPKVSAHRVPVPSLSPEPCPHDGVSAGSHDSHEEGTVGGHQEQTSNPSRIVPSLSINTASSAQRFLDDPQYLFASDGLRPFTTPITTPISNKEKPQSALSGTTDFLGLKLRPVSTMFSSHFSDHLLDPEGALSERDSEPSLELDLGTPTTTTHSGSASPLSPNSSFHTLSRSGLDKLGPVVVQDGSQSEVVHALQAQISGAKQAWQRHIWELEGQVRDLKAEIEELKHADSGDYCGVCGRGHRRPTREEPKVGVMHRPRAHTAVSSRFGSSLEA